MSYCAAGTNGRLDLRRRAFALVGRVSAEWSRCSGSMARHPRDSVAPQRSHTVSIAKKLSRLDACEDGNVVRWCMTQAFSQGCGAGAIARSRSFSVEPGPELFLKFWWSQSRSCFQNLAGAGARAGAGG